MIKVATRWSQVSVVSVISFHQVELPIIKFSRGGATCDKSCHQMEPLIKLPPDGGTY